MKPGFKTTEFWLALASLAGGVALVLTGHEEVGKWLMTAAVGSYTVGRGIAKVAKG